MIKRLIYFFFAAFYLLLYSCDSPQEVVDEPPIISVIHFNSSIMLGDTLTLHLRVNDLTLKSGSIDFKDGNLIVFNNLMQQLDTTVLHVYDSVGTYHVEIKFTDGENTTIEQLIVNVAFEPLLITLSTNTALLEVEDTLYVSLFVSGSELTSGYLDFKDGTIITFSNFGQVLDTTIAHKFTQVGLYDIKASFNNSNKNDSVKTEIQVIDIPPGLYLSVNKTNIELGDTLLVNLRVSNAIYGTLNFDDGTIIDFSNFNQDLDTTIAHIYSQLGGPNYVQATFSDGNYSSYRSKAVYVSRYYELNLSIGMKWRFKHYFRYYVVIGDHIDDTRNGVYEWEIVSFDDSDSTFNVQQTICDTVHITDSNGLDTTYIVNQSSLFKIQALYEKITFHFTFRYYPFIVPNHTLVSSYPVKIGDYPDYLILVDVIGPNEYRLNQGTTYSNTSKRLTLIDFTINNK